MSKKYIDDDVMREYLHDRYDEYDYPNDTDDDDDDALSELEGREYWRNVLFDELRLFNK